MNGSLSKPHRGRHEAINREKMNNSLRSKGYPATVDLSPIAMSEGGVSSVNYSMLYSVK